MYFILLTLDSVNCVFKFVQLNYFLFLFFYSDLLWVMFIMFFSALLSLLLSPSALSQDEQEDAQLRIEDILQMVRKSQHLQSYNGF